MDLDRIKIEYIILLLFCCFGSLGTLNAQTDEYMVQVVFSEKFTRFISWPDDSNVQDTSLPFTICIVGETEAVNYFNQLFVGNQKKIKNKTVKIINFNSEEEITQCNMIYIASDDSDSIHKVVEQVKGKPILTISQAGIPESESVVFFYLKNKKILFDIDIDVAKEQQLKISHLLLNHCKRKK